MRMQSKRGGINAIVADEDISLNKAVVATKDVNLTIDEVTLAQALASLKTSAAVVKRDSAATLQQTATISSPRKGLFNMSWEAFEKKDQIQFLIGTGSYQITVSLKKMGDLRGEKDEAKSAKIKELMKIILDEEEVAIDAIPLATKPPTIVDWKIHKE
ncbi:hypothetical protein Tco_0729334 [Tanacetum coccineum]|uniref:Uncharacterized protein n=1 Tax=Tanacetum coccineum TaxID=301880 RepID=A0ABQ4YNP9_9ASTR